MRSISYSVRSLAILIFKHHLDDLTKLIYMSINSGYAVSSGLAAS